MKLRTVPITKAEAYAYVQQHHRHHGEALPSTGLLWIAAAEGSRLCGVAIVANPRAPPLCDGRTCEVARLCADGTRNVCSFLYQRAWRIMGPNGRGWERMVTYVLETETGNSVRAAGFKYLWTTKGGSQDCPSRRRVDRSPTGPKRAFGIGEWWNDDIAKYVQQHIEGIA